MSNFTPNILWYLITIDDPNFVSGKSMYETFQLLLKTVKFKFVILNYIDGSGKDWLIYSLQKKRNIILRIEDVLTVLCDVKQFDWGDFFLFKEYPIAWNDPEGAQYPYVIAQTDTTVRAIDDQHIYIYTPYQEIVEVIKENYEIESIKKDSLDKLNYPE